MTTTQEAVKTVTSLRYSLHEPGVFPPCADHPGARALVVTSTTRRWRGEQALPTSIHEHAPVCATCFDALIEGGD